MAQRARCPTHPDDEAGFSGEHVFCLSEGCEWEDELCDASAMPVSGTLSQVACLLPVGHKVPHESGDDAGTQAPYIWAKEPPPEGRIACPLAWPRHAQHRPGTTFILAVDEAEYAGICQDARLDYTDAPRLFWEPQIDPPYGFNEQERRHWFRSLTVVVGVLGEGTFGFRRTHPLLEMCHERGVEIVSRRHFVADRRGPSSRRDLSHRIMREREEFIRQHLGSVPRDVLEKAWRERERALIDQEAFDRFAPCDCSTCQRSRRVPSPRSLPMTYTASLTRSGFETRAIPQYRTTPQREIVEYVQRNFVGTPEKQAEMIDRLQREIDYELRERLLLNPGPIRLTTDFSEPMPAIRFANVPFKAVLADAETRVKSDCEDLKLDLSSETPVTNASSAQLYPTPAAVNDLIDALKKIE